MKTADSIRLTGKVLAATLAVTLLTVSLRSQGAGDPIVLRPQKGLEGKPASIPRGEVLLFEVLQRFANFTGETVCFGSADSPQTTVNLQQAIDKLDITAARTVLEENGYNVSQETFRDRRVYWVQRAIVPPDRKGGIVRPGRREATGDTGSTEAAGPRSSLRLYRMEEGGGARYMLILETDSRKDAENAMSLLEARRGLGEPAK